MIAHHILTYACDLSGGGVERAQLRLARSWLAEGRRVTFVVGNTDGPLAAEMPHGLEVVSLGSAAYMAQFRLPAIVRETRPDVIFCAGNFYTAIAAWTKLRLGADCPPIVGKMSNAAARGDHGAILDLGHRAWLTQHGWFLDHLVAMTPATAAEAGRLTRMHDRTSVIPNPPAPPVVDAPMPPLPDGRFVLGVGRLVPQKRWDRLIAALPALPRDVHLAILGEGELRGTLERQVAELGLTGRVRLLGHAADPLPAMARASMLALPSDYEGVPGVLREALSVGTPVVTTDSSPAVAEIVGDRRLGSIVARDDADALAAALSHWLAAPRPDPVPQPGSDSAARYLRLFDSLIRPPVRLRARRYAPAQS